MSRVYTIPAGAAFLPALARGLLARHAAAHSPFALADVTVLLPTQRAVRALEDVFLEQYSAGPSAALLLPKIKALGEDDEDELALFGDEAARDIPPAISASQRLIRLAGRLEPRARDFEEALGWARSLARFLDEVLTDEKDLAQVAAAVPEELSAEFAAAREFLDVLAHDWPNALAEMGVIERAERRRLTMAAFERSWAAHPPGALYIAGSTGTIPATRRLMKAALALPQGALILPGVDRALDDESWDAIDEGHAQFGLKQLLEEIGLARAQVVDWPYTEERPHAHARARLLAEVLRPAPTTDSWAEALATHSLEDALDGLGLLIARDRAEEARAIALALREALETPGATAALVTPDRALARHVASELGRWGIAIEDSAGLPLLDTAPASLMRLILTALAGQFAPVALLALLKHPLVCLARDHGAHMRAASALERSVLRGPRPTPGIEGLRLALRRKSPPPLAGEGDHPPVRAERGGSVVEGGATGTEQAVPPSAPEPALGRAFGATRVGHLPRERGRMEAEALIDRLEEALRPLTNMGASSAPIAHWVEALSAAAQSSAPDLWDGHHAEALAAFLAELAEAGGPGLTRDEFAALLEHAGQGRAVRPRVRAHPRLAIWGLLEARLQSAGFLVLGALNEGVWPQGPDAGPWANRTIRAAIGLSQPERWIGLVAHDFAGLAAGPRVLLTASEKVDGGPARPSRFLMRLLNFLGGRKAAERRAGVAHGAWARELIAPDRYRPVAPPQPRPPVALRPDAFSITEIKTLRRDPYAIFAKRVLRLRPLEPVDAEIGPREMGSLFHKILEDFGRAFPDALPGDAERALLEIADRHLSGAALAPDLHLLWRRRLQNMARDFLAWEEAQRREARILGVEKDGEIALSARDRTIKLRGRIDRIDAHRATGALRIYDYKTGSPPSLKQVECMLDPQLALGAFLALQGALEGVSGEIADRLGYLRVGGAKAPIDERTFDVGVAELIAASVGGLIHLLASYEDPAKPYLSWPIREKVTDRGDYDLLARIAEWRAADGSDDWL